MSKELFPDAALDAIEEALRAAVLEGLHQLDQQMAEADPSILYSEALRMGLVTDPGPDAGDDAEDSP